MGSERRRFTLSIVADTEITKSLRKPGWAVEISDLSILRGDVLDMVNTLPEGTTSGTVILRAPSSTAVEEWYLYSQNAEWVRVTPP